MYSGVPEVGIGSPNTASPSALRSNIGESEITTTSAFKLTIASGAAAITEPVIVLYRRPVEARAHASPATCSAADRNTGSR